MSTSNIQRAMVAAHIDLAPQLQPSLGSLAAATVVALGASLGIDALLVAIGTAIFPATKGFAHFRVTDYGLLTTLGVLVACGGWPLTARLTSTPRWLFFRLAILITLVLWLPDLWILARGEPADAVGVLMVMHLAIAVVTYNALVHIAVLKPVPLGRAEALGDDSAPAGTAQAGTAQAGDGATEHKNLSEHPAAWRVMLSLVSVESALGVAALLFVPVGRPSGWLPHQGTLVYVLHAVVGAALAVGAVALMASANHAERSVRVSAIIGLVGVVMSGLGGFVTVYHALRLLGLALMLVGAMIAVLGYMMPAIGPPEAAPSGSA